MSQPKWISRRRREQSWILLLLAVFLAVLLGVLLAGRGETEQAEQLFREAAGLDGSFER